MENTHKKIHFFLEEYTEKGQILKDNIVKDPYLLRMVLDEYTWSE